MSSVSFAQFIVSFISNQIKNNKNEENYTYDKDQSIFTVNLRDAATEFVNEVGKGGKITQNQFLNYFQEKLGSSWTLNLKELFTKVYKGININEDDHLDVNEVENLILSADAFDNNEGQIDGNVNTKGIASIFEDADESLEIPYDTQQNMKLARDFIDTAKKMTDVRKHFEKN